MSLPKKIYGLIGYPVKHSLSPLMHNAAFHALKIDAEYRLFEVAPQELENFLLADVTVKDVHGEEVKVRDISGFNITIPHKVRAKEILGNRFPYDVNTSLMSEAYYYVEFTGAVNTVKREAESMAYFNTDAPGFLKSLTEDLRFDTNGKTILVVGCGGAGRAVIAALGWKQEGIKKILISDIDAKAIHSAREHFLKIPQFSYLKDRCEFILAEKIPDIVIDCDLLINASPVGMKGEDKYDRDKETRLVKDAKSRRLRVADGLSMLLYQGAYAFELWSGQVAPVEVMRRALNEGISR